MAQGCEGVSEQRSEHEESLYQNSTKISECWARNEERHFLVFTAGAGAFENYSDLQYELRPSNTTQK
jgi:hypothetical protein